MGSHHKRRRTGRPNGTDGRDRTHQPAGVDLSDGDVTGRSVRGGAVVAVGQSDDDAVGQPRTPGRLGIPGQPGIPSRPGATSRPAVPNRDGVGVAGRRHVPGARRVSDALGVPVDIALNMPRMSFEGNARLVLDNHRGLVEYTPSHLQINTPAGQIDITGRRLRIRGISREQIVADGWFDRVEFSGWVGSATPGSANQEAP